MSLSQKKRTRSEDDDGEVFDGFSMNDNNEIFSEDEESECLESSQKHVEVLESVMTVNAEGSSNTRTNETTVHLINENKYYGECFFYLHNHLSSDLMLQCIAMILIILSKYVLLTDHSLKQIQELYEKGELKCRSRLSLPKSKRFKSTVWQTFHELYDKDSIAVPYDFFCIQCKKIISCRPGERKSSNKLEIKPLIRHTCETSAESRLENYFKSTKIINVHSNDIEESKHAFTKFVALDMRPVFAIEGAGLRNLCKTFFEMGQKYSSHNSEAICKKLYTSRNTVSCHATTRVKINLATCICSNNIISFRIFYIIQLPLQVRQNVVKEALQAKKEITKTLHTAIKEVGGFASTVDLWTDNFKKQHYIAITAHLNIISNDGFKKKNFIIGVDAIEGTKGVNIEAKIVEMFQCFDVDSDKIRKHVVFVTDRGSNIQAALSTYERTNCIAHIINNVVKRMCQFTKAKEIIDTGMELVR